jgi:hypothetical protein
MLHRYHLTRGAPWKGCATDKWAPPSTRAWGVRPPYLWRMHLWCATHSVDNRGAPHIHAPRIRVGPPSGKGGRHIRGACICVAPRLYVSVEHHFEVRHGYVVPTTIKVPSPLPPTPSPHSHRSSASSSSSFLHPHFLQLFLHFR